MFLLRSTYRISLFTLVFLGIAACGISKTPNKAISIILKDSVDLQLDRDAAFDSLRGAGGYIFSFQGKPSIFFVNGNKCAIWGFSLSPSSKGKRLDLGALNAQLRNNKISNIVSVNSPDSIFAFSNKSYRIFLMNASGDLIHSWFVNNNFNGIDYRLFGQVDYKPVAFNKAANTLYFGEYLSEHPASGNEFLKRSQFAAIKLLQDTAVITHSFGSFPAFYQNRFYGMSGSHKNVVYYDNQVLASYYLSDSIYSYQLGPSNAQTFGYRAASPFVTPTFDDYDKIPERSDNTAAIEFDISHPIYGFLNVRPGAPFAYRVVQKPYHYYNVDSTINNVVDRPFSLIVLNKHLQSLGEISFQEKKFWFFTTIPDSKGFWIAQKSSLNKLYFYEMDI